MFFEFQVPNMLYKFYTKSQAQAQKEKLDYIKAYQEQQVLGSRPALNGISLKLRQQGAKTGHTPLTGVSQTLPAFLVQEPGSKRATTPTPEQNLCSTCYDEKLSNADLQK